MKAPLAAWVVCAMLLALPGCVSQQPQAATGIPLIDVLSGNYQPGTVPLIDALRGDTPELAGNGPPSAGPSNQGLLPPYQSNAYSPGVHADSTGRPFTYQPANPGDNMPVMGPVRRDGYGLGTHIDQFGRPVRDRPVW